MEPTGGKVAVAAPDVAVLAGVVLAGVLVVLAGVALVAWEEMAEIPATRRTVIAISTFQFISGMAAKEI
jgi:hypothetical protein